MVKSGRAKSVRSSRRVGLFSLLSSYYWTDGNWSTRSAGEVCSWRSRSTGELGPGELGPVMPIGTRTSNHPSLPCFPRRRSGLDNQHLTGNTVRLLHDCLTLMGRDTT